MKALAISLAAFLVGCASAATPCYEARGGKVKANPAYPIQSRLAGEQGKSIIRAFVSDLGYPESVELIESSGFDKLDQAAIDAVKNLCFIPASHHGKPVASWVRVPLVFRRLAD